MVIFHKQRAKTLEGMVGYGPLSGRRGGGGWVGHNKLTTKQHAKVSKHAKSKGVKLLPMIANKSDPKPAYHKLTTSKTDTV